MSHFFSGKRLLEVGDYVGTVFDAYGEPDEVGGHSGFAQLLVGELAVGVGGGMEHACAGVGHVGHYRYEFQAVHEFGGLLARPFEAE